MTAPVFRLDPLPAVDVVELGGEEGRHASTVRRVRVGERIDLTDGRGTLAEGIVVDARRDRLDVRIERRLVLPAPAPRIVAVQALVKGERSELAVELLTELGVDEIVPWEADRCVARWTGEKSARRWTASAESAAKQSRRAHWPVVAPAAATVDVVPRLRAAAFAAVLSEDANEPLVGQLLPTAGDIVLVVGPEGGISPAELKTFAEVGAGAFRLGPTVLRASTAGAAAAAVLLAAAGRW